MQPLAYSLVYVIPALTAMGLLWGGPWLVPAPLVVFGLVPLADLILPEPESNPEPVDQKQRLADWRYDAVICLALPVQFILVGLFLAQVAAGAFQGWELAGAIVGVGLGCGGLGINIAHELGHREDWRHQFAAKVLLATSLYTHFFIEHNRGHHARVATPDDPATSRKNEWVYTFWFRSLAGGYLGAWELEAQRLARRDQAFWTWNNEMVRLQTGQALLLLAILGLFGPVATLSFMGASLFGALLLETVNYLEHYGLQRDRNEQGRWKRVQPAHSWNSNGVMGRLLLFELTRHSDHHAHPKRQYPVLRHFDEAPQLPTGYPGMILLALAPPLFHAVMNPRIPTQSLPAQDYEAA